MFDELHGLAIKDIPSLPITEAVASVEAVKFYWCFNNKNIGDTTSTCAQHMARVPPSWCGHDLAADQGTPLYPVAGGSGSDFAVCTFAGSDFATGWGYYVVLDHGSFQSWYAHMKAGSIKVHKGDLVKVGTVIGQVGSTGNSTGPHVHIGFWDKKKQAWFDPWPWIKGAMPYKEDNGVSPIPGIKDWVEGIDVSSWQQKINWFSVPSNKKIAIIRLGVSTSKDEMFDENVKNAKNAGKKITVYHVPRFDHDISFQVDWIKSQLQDIALDYPIVLDCEDNTHSKTPEQVEKRLGTMVGRLKGFAISDPEKYPTIYTRKNWWDANVAGDIPWSNYCLLWVANFVDDPYTTSPAIPKSWKECAAWQYSDTGRVSGISTNVDLDLFDPKHFPVDTIEPPEAVIIAPSNVKAGTLVTLDGSQSTGEIKDYYWDLGDGSSGYSKIVSKYYDVGEYTITLTVTDIVGQSSSSSHVLVVTENEPPPATGGAEMGMSVDWPSRTGRVDFAINLGEPFGEIKGYGDFDVVITEGNLP